MEETKKMFKKHLIISISLLVFVFMALLGAGVFILTFAPNILPFFAIASGLMLVVPEGLLETTVRNYKESKKIEKFGEQLNEINQEFTLQLGSSDSNEKELLPYLPVAMSFNSYLKDKSLNYYEISDLTHKLISEMQRSGYNNDEIAEYLVSIMYETKDDKKLPQELKLIKKLKIK